MTVGRRASTENKREEETETTPTFKHYPRFTKLDTLFENGSFLKLVWIHKAMCCFSSLFFSPNLCGRAGKKQNVQRKKKRTGSVFQTTWPTNDAPSSLCWAQSFLFFLNFFLFPNDDKVKQLPIASVRKFDLFPVAFFAGKERFWLFPSDQHHKRIRLPAPRSLAKC